MSDPRSQRERAVERNGEARTAISEGIVALLKDYYGRGPEKAKTYYHDDLVVCLLRGGFTRVEQTLLEGGRTHAVIEQRMAFQEVMRHRFQEVIEHATGQRVIGFMSGNQQEPTCSARCSCSLPPTCSTTTLPSRRRGAGPGGIHGPPPGLRRSTMR